MKSAKDIKKFQGGNQNVDNLSTFLNHISFNNNSIDRVIEGNKMAVVSVHKLVAPLTNAFQRKTSSSTKNKIYSKFLTNKFNICIILTKKLALSDTQKIYVDCEVRY